ALHDALPIFRTLGHSAVAALDSPDAVALHGLPARPFAHFANGIRHQTILNQVRAPRASIDGQLPLAVPAYAGAQEPPLTAQHAVSVPPISSMSDPTSASLRQALQRG